MRFKPAFLLPVLLLAISAVTQAQTLRHLQALTHARTQTQAQVATGAGTALKIRPNTTDCAVTFDNALPKFCVTQNGNIEDFEFPDGFNQIFTEGYGICDETATETSYFDVGTRDSGNWLPGVITAGGANNKLPLTITRNTADGIWTITQTFTRNTMDEYVKAQITLKNNTAVTRFVEITRYVDIDADEISADNFFQGISNSAFGFLSLNENFPNHGLLVHALASPHNYFGFNVPAGDVDPCNFTNNDVINPTNGDEAVMYMWIPNGGTGVVPAKKSIKFVLEYRAM